MSNLLAETKGKRIFRAVQPLIHLKMRSTDYYPSLGGKLLVFVTVNLERFS